MKNRKIKILGYGLYLLISIGLLILLFMMRDQFNWIAGGLRELFTYLLIGLTIIFSIIAITKYLKSRNRKTVFFGLVGIIPCFLAIPFFEAPVFIEKNSLSEKVETIELTYIAWACDCANWATKEDLKKYSENIGDSLAYQSIFIEPSDESIKLPDTLGYSNDIIKFTGQFYQNRGFPKDYQSFENPDKARIFRYTDYEVVKSNYGEYQKSLSENE
ncbi:conserved membrane protein of unknown function [Tenacibaculum sp. 190130A14a]|uniref:Uncharacterized protein n=1 Tax=Tenacibaculum polynesiense TaxID=3137857 RepID=A0ABM9P7K3_9FLAO